MTKQAFWKMQACGNDFMVLDLRHHERVLSPESIQKWADRHFGVGFDSLLVLKAAQNPQHTAFYEVYNADGSIAGQCGNGARCIAHLLASLSSSSPSHFTLETRDQLLSLEVLKNGLLQTGLAIPHYQPEDLPIHLPVETSTPLATYALSFDNQSFYCYGVWLGNPHAVILVEDLDNAPVVALGQWLNQHPLFPEGINVGFAKVLSLQAIQLRVYERGVGETLACGSGACAAGIATSLLQKASLPLSVSLPGGTVEVFWKGSGHAVYLTGPAEKVFEGVIDI